MNVEGGWGPDTTINGKLLNSNVGLNSEIVFPSLSTLLFDEISIARRNGFVREMVLNIIYYGQRR